MSLMSSSKRCCLFPLFLSCFDSLYYTTYINTAFGIAYLRRLRVLLVFFIFVLLLIALIHVTILVLYHVQQYGIRCSVCAPILYAASAIPVL